MSIYALFLLFFIAVTAVAADSPCREVNKCIRPMEKYNSVFDLLPWRKDIPSLCNDASGFFGCLQAIPMTQCNVLYTEAYGSLKKQAVSIVCSSDSSALLNSKCATSYNSRSDANNEVENNCSGMTWVADGETKCSMADKLKDCIRGALDSSCGQEFATFLDRLWTASGTANGGCDKKWAYANAIYNSYTPIIL